MKNYIYTVTLILFITLLASCSNRELSVGYGNTCFTKDNEIVYIKHHSYLNFNYFMFLSQEEYESFKYICKMDLNGNEEVIDMVPEGIAISHISEGDGRLCFQTHYYEVFTYDSGEFRKVFEDGRGSLLSFNGEKIARNTKINDSYPLVISNFDGSNEVNYLASPHFSSTPFLQT